MKTINPEVIRSIIESGGKSRAEGCRRVLSFVREGLKANKFTADNFSYKNLGLAMGVIDPYDEVGSFKRMCFQALSSEAYREQDLIQESNPGVNTNAFQILTGELIASKMIEGYSNDNGYIGDKLITNMPGQRLRNQRLAGITHLAGPEEVKEGHPYPETGFEDKYVTTKEAKKGRILSLNEELLLLDQTGEINRRAMMLGESTREERERTIVRGVVDADASTDPVYRPSGTGETLYATDGSNLNYVGVGGVSGFDAAVALADWTDLDTVLQYRDLKVVDDRVDGTQRTISGLNGPQNILLLPSQLRATGWYILNQTGGVKNTNLDAAGTQADQTNFNRSPVAGFVGEVLSSSILSEINAADWYYGNFRKQFIWTELMPLTVSTQGRDSEASFERDVALRVKVRYYGGISAVDSRYVTKVDGA